MMEGLSSEEMLEQEFRGQALGVVSLLLLWTWRSNLGRNGEQFYPATHQVFALCSSHADSSSLCSNFSYLYPRYPL